MPELLAKPKTIISEPQDLGSGGVQHRIEVEVAPGVLQIGFLLVPTGRTAARRPAVSWYFTRPKPVWLTRNRAH